MAYYNEFDPYAADWLESLAATGEIESGTIDRRSIHDVQATDVAAYKRCHFFAGVAGWELALRLAGWPTEREVWTGSCPCQPYSSAGKGLGDADERNLWPVWFPLIRECRPATIFGEQVARAIRHGWLDRVFADLEGEGYACGAVVLGAHSVGAPHIRQRLFWMAKSESERGRRHCRDMGKTAGTPREPRDGRSNGDVTYSSSTISGLENTDGVEFRGQSSAGDESLLRTGEAIDGLEHATRDGRNERGPESGGGSTSGRCESDRLGDTDNTGLPQRVEPQDRCGTSRSEGPTAVATGSPWDGGLTYCRDGKYRRIPHTGSGVQPLAARIPRKLGSVLPGVERVAERAARSNRVGRLKGYGNAIVPQVAAEFVKAFLDR